MALVHGRLGLLLATLVPAWATGCMESGSPAALAELERLQGGAGGAPLDAPGGNGTANAATGATTGDDTELLPPPPLLSGGSAGDIGAVPAAEDAGLLPADADNVPRASFDNPLNASSGADPWMTYYEGRYYLMATTWNSTLTMRHGATIAELEASEPLVIWTGDDPNRCCNIWAPEFHLLDGPNGPRWYVYFTAGRAGNDFGFQRMHVLESAGVDPLGPYTYRATFFPNTWAIDGSILELAGNRYLLFSSSQGTQNIYIAPLSNPWTVSGPRVLLSQPDQAWERLGDFPVNEGPAALYHEGRTFITYSASHCASPEYKLGLLELNAADPLTPGAWTKAAAPVFSQAPALSVFGPGHNGFFKSPDGTEDWIVYHGNDGPNDGCYLARTTRIQPFTWSAAGTPDFGTPVALGTAMPVPSGE